MSFKFSVIVLITSLFIVTNIYAHDPSKHVGKSFIGKVLSIEENTFVLKTDKDEIKVMLDKKTKIEKGDVQATREDISNGSSLQVFGTRLASGELVAKEIVIGSEHQQ